MENNKHQIDEKEMSLAGIYSPLWRNHVLVLMFFTLLSNPAADAAVTGFVEYCKPFSFVGQIPVDLDKPFLPYLIHVSDAGGNKQIDIVGETISIDRATMGVLSRLPNAADKTIESIRISARKIILKEPMAAIDAQITLRGKDIEFQEGGYITLLSKKAAKLRIIAETFSIDGSGFRHFDVRPTLVDRENDDKGLQLGGIVDVQVKQLLINGDLLDQEVVVDTLVSRFTLQPIIDFTNSISVTYGEEGSSKWLKDLKKNSAWLEYSAAVWRAAYMVSPFDECLAESLKREIESNLSIFEESASGKLFFEISSLLSAIDGHVDLEGNGPAWSTNIPLARIIEDIEQYQTDKGSGRSKIDYFVAMLKESVSGTPVPQEEHQKYLRDQDEIISSAVVEYQASSSRLIELEANLASLTSLTDEINAAYGAREQRLKEHQADLERGAQDRAKIVSGLATAASIVTTAYTGSPSTGSAVGGVIYAGYEASEGRDAWDSLSSGYQFSRKILGPLEAMNGALGELAEARSKYKGFIRSFQVSNITIEKEIEVPVKNPDPDDPDAPTTKKITRDEALKDLAKKGTKLKSGLDGVYKVYKEFVPEPSPVPKVIEEDRTLKDLGQQLVDVLEKIKEVTIEVEALQRLTLEQHETLVNAAEKKAEFTDLPIGNEVRRKEMGDLAIEGIREEISRFSKRIDLIRRLSLMEFREPLPVDPNRIQDIFVMQRLGESFNPLEIVSQKEIGERYLKYVESRRDYISLLAAQVTRASELQFLDYVDARGRAPMVVRPTEEIIDSVSSPSTERAFIRLLNQNLRRQYLARDDTDELKKLVSTRLEIPFDIKRKLDARFPARLLQVAITDVEYSGKMSGGDVIFSIDVERVGNLRNSKTIIAETLDKEIETLAIESCASKQHIEIDCFAVDLRPKTVAFHNYFVPYEFTIGQIDEGGVLKPTDPPSYWYLRPGDSSPSNGRTMMVTYPPAESRMYLRTRIDPNASWRSAPIIQRMTIEAEVFQ